MPLRTSHPSSDIFDDLSYSTRYSSIEFLLAITAGSEAEIGWTEGIVHEAKSTQEGTKILLVNPLPPPPTPLSSESNQGAVSDENKMLEVFINCTNFSRFVFTIKQHIKISLKGARGITDLDQTESGVLPFSLVFSGDLAIQYVGGGICIPNGTVIDTRQGHGCQGACLCLEFSTSTLSVDNPGVAPPQTPRRRFSLRTTRSLSLGQASTQNSNRSINIDYDYNDIETYPPLNSLTQGMVTPLIGMVETIQAPSPTNTGNLCVSLVLSDVSSYSSRRGFRVTCFTSNSGIARALPAPSPGDVILFKSVNIQSWAGGVSGVVHENKLDWIVYERDLDRVVPAEHAISDIMNGHDVEGFYTDVLARKRMF